MHVGLWCVGDIILHYHYWYAFNAVLKLIKHIYLQEKKAQDLQQDYYGLSERRHRCTK